MPSSFKPDMGYVFLGLGLLLAFAGLIVQGRPLTGSEEAAPSDSPDYLFPFITQPEQIIGMELSNSAQEVLSAVVVEADQGTWRLRDEPFSPVEAQRAEQARLLLGSMQAVARLDAREIPLQTLGLLPNPQYVLRFQVDDLQVISFAVGDITPSGQAYYVYIPNEQVVVHLVAREWIEALFSLLLELPPRIITAASATPSP
jgi:hypothetical protein